MKRKEGILSDAAAQGRLRETVKDRDTLVAEAIKDVMRNPSGRLALSYIINDLLGLRSVCVEGSERTAAIWEGRRLAAKLIDELLEQADTSGYDLMYVERIKRKRDDEQTRTTAAEHTEDARED